MPTRSGVEYLGNAPSSTKAIKMKASGKSGGSVKKRPVHTASRIQTTSSSVRTKPAGKSTTERKRARVQELSKVRAASRKREVDKRRAVSQTSAAGSGRASDGRIQSRYKPDVGIEDTDGGTSLYSDERKPGYIFIQRRVDYNSAPTNCFKIDVRSDQDLRPPEVTNCGSFSLKLVTCKHVVCINKAKEVAHTVLSDYADVGNGEGWYKVNNSDSYMFILLFNNYMNNYRANT